MNATREDVEQAAKMASIHNEICEFEHGYETIIGERGVTLSGGQKQRIAMARAFLADPTILILDDSLSAVDTQTEKDILEQFVRFRTGKTTVIIAHRVSSIQHADQIIVIRQGRIAEAGNHEELLQNGKYYRDLYEKQQIEERLKERA
jgi:ATP-binding cassette subfamily B protein